MTTRLRCALALALLPLAGCFNYSEPVCSFSCNPDAGTAACPGSYECRSDGYCHKQGTTASCDFSDAALPPDMSDLSAQLDDGGNNDQSIDQSGSAEPDLSSQD